MGPVFLAVFLDVVGVVGMVALTAERISLCFTSAEIVAQAAWTCFGDGLVPVLGDLTTRSK